MNDNLNTKIKEISDNYVLKSDYLVVGFKKCTNKSDSTTVNAHIMNEYVLRKTFAWIDNSAVCKHFRSENTKLSLDDLINKIKNTGVVWCENDDYGYLIRYKSSF